MSLSKEEKDTILDYWKYLDTLEEDVRKAVLLVWDETGRPVNEVYIGVAELLDNCDEFDQFYEKYRAFILRTGITDYKIMNDAKMYWHTYMRGIKRVGKS